MIKKYQISELCQKRGFNDSTKVIESADWEYDSFNIMW